MTSTNQIAIQNYMNPVYPSEPVHNDSCPLNQIYQTLPNSTVQWETTAAGPSSIKHLYGGVANYYPIQRINRPVDTMYGYDFSKYHKSGAGRGKRIGYHYKVYPFTDRNVREERDYADVILPNMDFRNWTKYPVQRDSTLNSSLREFPQAYQPDLRH